MLCKSGRLIEARALWQEFQNLARPHSDKRAWMRCARVGATVLAQTGEVAAAFEELQTAADLAAEIGAPEQLEVAETKAALLLDAGRFSDFGAELGCVRKLIDTTGFVSASELADAMQLRWLCAAGAPQTTPRRLGMPDAPLAAGFVDALEEQAGLLAGEEREPDTEHSCREQLLEEQGIRADTAALRLERRRGQAAGRSAWCTAVSTWAEYGCSIWLARARWRSGDRDAAEETLRKLGAGDEQRTWCETWGRT